MWMDLLQMFFFVVVLFQSKSTLEELNSTWSSPWQQHRSTAKTSSGQNERFSWWWRFPGWKLRKRRLRGKRDKEEKKREEVLSSAGAPERSARLWGAAQTFLKINVWLLSGLGRGRKWPVAMAKGTPWLSGYHGNRPERWTTARPVSPPETDSAGSVPSQRACSQNTKHTQTEIIPQQQHFLKWDQ